MGFFSDLFGGVDEPPASGNPERRRVGAQRAPTDDELAIRRYQYLMDTAPPEDIEAVHREAFAKLTPKQREMLARQLADEAPPGEAPASAQPNDLAVAATRSEMRQPGSMARAMYGVDGGRGFGGGGFMDSMLGTIAGYVIASTLMSSFLPSDTALFGGDFVADGSSDAGSDAATDTGMDGGSIEAASGDFGAADFGGDFGDFGF